VPIQLGLTDEQTLFHETTVRFIEAELPITATRAWHEHPVGYDRGWLQKAADIGWFAMLVPEEDGGGSVSGTGLLDAAILAEEMGRNVQPGPFIPMNVVASALATSGSPAQKAAWLPGIVGGTTVGTWAFADERGNWDGGAGLVLVGGVLRGTRGYVQDAASAELLLATATRDGAPVQVLVPASAAGVRVEPLECLDLSRRVAHVTFDDVAVEEDQVLDADGLERQLEQAVALCCAETVGAVDALLAMTVAYSKDRIAFGRPIGSFQALKHVMADQAVYLEACKAAAVSALQAVAAGDEAAAEMVSMAASYIGDTANDIAQECLQVHGGIGYTWEHDLHLLMRRVRSNAALYGEPSWHRERVCAFHRLGVSG
jgi:alkylation response protein AidB-like acyl-CoA dehydrogenase